MGCHYYFLIMGLRFKYKDSLCKDSLCNDCHDLLKQFVYISDIAVITEDAYYRCIIYDISKSDATKLLENSMLDDREYI